MWYPTLETELEKLRETPPDNTDDITKGEVESPRAQEILEEILELSRINQKLLRNPDGSFGGNLEEINNRLADLMERLERPDDPFSIRKSRRFHPMMLEELLHFSHRGKGRSRFVGVQMALALIRNQFPWIYDAGVETINILRSRRSIDDKHAAMNEFEQLLEFSFEHPIMRDVYGGSKEYRMFYHELPRLLRRAMEESMEG